MRFKRNRERQEWVNWLSEIRWEIFVTLDFNHKIEPSRALTLVNKFYDKLVKTTIFKRIKFCAVNIFSISNNGTYHVHSLLASDHAFPQNFGNLKLKPINPLLKIEEAWKREHGDCDAQPIIEGTNKNLCGYLADYNIHTSEPDRWELSCYRQSLFERLRNHDKKPNSRGYGCEDARM